MERQVTHSIAGRIGAHGISHPPARAVLLEEDAVGHDLHHEDDRLQGEYNQILEVESPRGHHGGSQRSMEPQMGG